MSIILKGIDMPKSCGGCEFNYNLEGGSYEWWECVILHDDINQFDTRRTDCPLIEIPTPHGRLIDGDKFKETMGDTNMDIYTDEVKEHIDDAPTILEAEGQNGKDRIDHTWDSCRHHRHTDPHPGVCVPCKLRELVGVHHRGDHGGEGAEKRRERN